MPLDDNLTGTIEEDAGDAKIIVQYKNGKKHGRPCFYYALIEG